MKEIKLTHGQVALVDDEDFEYLNQWKWCAHETKYGSYAKRTTGKNPTKSFRMHRVILGAKKGELVDHRNHKTLDNRRENIRICTKSQNCQNQRNRKNTSSHYKGVGYKKKDRKWSSGIKLDGIFTSLGYYDTELEAAIIYNITCRRYFGEFALPNILTKISY